MHAYETPSSPPAPAVPAYTHHHRHRGVEPYNRKMSTDTPATCPKMLQPHDIHFMVINMDRSTKRLELMTASFQRLGFATRQMHCIINNAGCRCLSVLSEWR